MFAEAPSKTLGVRWNQMLGLDGFELNKIAGAVLGTLLVSMGLGIVAEETFHAGKPEKPGFAIEVTETAAEPEQAGAAEATPIAALLANADADKGVAAAKPCLACHSFEKGGPVKTGPNLWQVVGRAPGAMEGFAYSEAMKAKAGEPWSYETLDKFIADPKGYLPGTKMSYPGLKKNETRADLIAFLRTLSDSPAALPAPPLQSGAEPPAAAPEGATETQPAVRPEGQPQAQ
jgi:cytochrome c